VGKLEGSRVANKFQNSARDQIFYNRSQSTGRGRQAYVPRDLSIKRDFKKNNYKNSGSGGVASTYIS
jgi:hypothetical protein